MGLAHIFSSWCPGGEHSEITQEPFSWGLMLKHRVVIHTSSHTLVCASARAGFSLELGVNIWAVFHPGGGSELHLIPTLPWNETGITIPHGLFHALIMETILRCFMYCSCTDCWSFFSHCSWKLTHQRWRLWRHRALGISAGGEKVVGELWEPFGLK